MRKSQAEEDTIYSLSSRISMNAVGTGAKRTATLLISVLGLASCMASSDPMQVRHVREAPPSRDCPYVIPTEEEAFSRGLDPSIPGNALWVKDLKHGRLGNRIIGLAHVLQLGACCKSKMVALPLKSELLMTGTFNEGTPGPRWFDFSDAPDFDGFDSSTCPTNITWQNGDAFWLKGCLTRCIQRSRQVRCEATYIFPTDLNVCDSNELANVDDRELDVDVGRGIQTQKDYDDGDNKQEQEYVEANETPVSGGNLAIHVRSGDIFHLPVHPWYGQPPLQYYLRVLEEQQWSRVDFVTNNNQEKSLMNPVFPVLESKYAKGELTGNIHFHANRTMEKDLLSMLCSDGVVMAKSTLARALAFHVTATRIYFPYDCWMYMHDLVDQRPETQVYAMMSSSGLDDYSPYDQWNMTEHQLEQMITYNITGFKECRGKFGSRA